MKTMLRRSLLRISLFLAISGLAVTAIDLHAQDDSGKWTRKYKTPPASARIEVTILKAANGKPIENAAVIFHPIEGDSDKGALELKTNEDGKAIIDVIPIGDTVRLQVIAHGFQTYGQDYKIDKTEMSMEVRMKRPGQQYSIYKNGNTANSDKSTAPPKNSAPPAKDDKGSGTDQNQSQDQAPPK
jgi:5-hydroxyisourate hydrolase-like protein (transthyretin family)